MEQYRGYFIIGGVLVAFVIYGAVMRSLMATANPAAQLSAIATALGMQIVEGDPNMNVVIGPRQSFLLALFGITQYEMRARMVGQLGPFATRFELHDKLFQVKLRRFVVHRTEVFQCAIVLAGVRAPFPFEAWRSSPYGGGPEPSAGFPVVTQGTSPSGTWYLASPDPRAAQWLGAMVNHFANSQLTMHLVMQGNELSLRFTKFTLGSACLQLTQLRDETARIASTLSQWGGAQQQPQQLHQHQPQAWGHRG